jgi:hypothetical protein
MPRHNCKKPIELLAELYTATYKISFKLEALYHPKGCMKARHSHLDIPPSKRLAPLLELAKLRGIKLPCKNVDKALEIHDLHLSIKLVIKPYTGRLHCRKHVYIMITNAGMLYLAPITYSKGSRAKHLPPRQKG